MSINLRPFQAKLEADIYAAWHRGARNVMPVSATGSGKTVVLSKCLADEPGASVAVAHRRELVGQISVALARNGVQHRIVGAKAGSALPRVIRALHIAEFGYHFVSPRARCGVGGVDTIVRMDAADPWFSQVKLIVQDEGHHILADNKWGRAAGMFPNARGLFPTATPERADGRGLGRHADGLVDELVPAPSMRDVICMGYLTDYKVYAPPSALDLSQVQISNATGDYNADSVRKAVHATPTITGDAVAQYLRLAAGKLGVTFCVDVEAAKDTAAAYRANGVPAEVVSAKTPDLLRAQVLRKFKAREIMQLVNVDLFGEGFDLPAIEVVSFARPTASFPLYVQQFGRTLRLMLTGDELRGYDSLSDAGRRDVIARSGKPFGIIIDHVGNVIRHGLPDAPRTMSLDRRERRSASKSDGVPLRVCLNPECSRPYERALVACPYCAQPAPPPANRSAPEFVDGDLLELDAATLAALRGEIARVDGDAVVPWGATAAVQGAVRRRHWERQQGQAALRNCIAWWAGLETARGRGESESYRRFYFRYGIDAGNAQTLGAREAEELAGRIAADLAALGVDATINAVEYFSNVAN